MGAALFGLMGLFLLFILGPAVVVFDGPPGRFGGPPIAPLLTILIVVLAVRLASRSRWR
jgi:hypothetical protein